MASIPPIATGPVPQLGRATGWRLVVGSVVVDHQHCWADINVTLDSGLSPGSFEIQMRGLTAEDFRSMAAARVPRATAPGEREASRGPLYGTLQLFWRDRVGSEPSIADAPVLFAFAVTALSRRNEGLRTITTIEGRHGLFDRLSRATTPPAGDAPVQALGPLEAARQVLASAGFADGSDFQVFTPAGAAATGTNVNMVVQANSVALAQLTALDDAMLRRYGRRGRGCFLLYGEKLLVGPFRPVPASGLVAMLDAASGFIAAQRQGQDSAVAETETTSDGQPLPPPRDIWQVQVVGRTDIKPGDVVRFTVPGEDAGLFGGFGLLPLPGAMIPDQTVTLYVSSVRHSMAVDRGWTMQLSGVTIDGEPIVDKAWDIIQATTDAVPATGEVTPRASAAGAIRARVGGIVAEELAYRPHSDVGEVRAATSATEMASSGVVRAGHSSDLLLGAADMSGAGAARDADINRSDAARFATNVPYLTPFAWGPFGLVLPRYPGTRVMVSYHHNSGHDPVDVGALWRTSDDAATSAPGHAEPGDWWLILPAGLGSAAGQSQSGRAAIAIPDDAKASHDLIDAAGERTIEVNGFTVRAFGADSLQAPAHRPEPPSGDNLRGGIQIEHVDSGAMISIATDGKITIKATSELVLEGVGIKLNPGSGTVDVGS